MCQPRDFQDRKSEPDILKGPPRAPTPPHLRALAPCNQASAAVGAKQALIFMLIYIVMKTSKPPPCP